MGAPPDQASQERQLALLVTSAMDYAIFMMDTEGRILTWNAGAERMKGYTREEIVGRPFSIFYTDADLARDHPAEELRIAVRDGRYEEEGWRVRKDGSRFWANIVITAVYDGGELIGFGKVSRDLTARRADEQRARARAAELEAANAELAAANVQLDEFRRLVSSVRDYAIFMLGPAGDVRSWNAGARRLKGYEPEEVVGRHFSLFYTDVDRARGHPAHELEIAGREGRYEEEGWRVRKDGTVFWASVTITAVRGEHGGLTGFAKVTRDLTARKRADDALRHAMQELRAANAELDRFAAVAAHDLTGPLSTISGFAQLLARADLPPSARASVEHIHASSVRLLEMVEHLLAYARAGASDRPPEAVDLLRTTEQALADLAGPIAERGASVAVAVPAGATVTADAGDVRLVLQNLIANAVKFGDPVHPRVAVAVAAQAQDDACWRVVVEDNGAGIAVADRDRIFRAFERAGTGDERPGHGLGLAICHRLVLRHGGRIGVDAAPGGGSRFWFTAPRAAPASEHPGGADGGD